MTTRYTRNGRDLESEVLERCVQALKLKGFSTKRRDRQNRYVDDLDHAAKTRILAYLKERFL